jgi:hypothetical protein
MRSCCRRRRSNLPAYEWERGTSVAVRRLSLPVNTEPISLSGRPTLGNDSIIIIKEYPSVRGTRTNPYPLALVNLVSPVGEQTADILKGCQKRTAETNDTRTSRRACSPYRRSWAPALFAGPFALSLTDWDPPCFRRAAFILSH